MSWSNQDRFILEPCRPTFDLALARVLAAEVDAVR
jgi:hypothetical protein